MSTNKESVLIHRCACGSVVAAAAYPAFLDFRARYPDAEMVSGPPQIEACTCDENAKLGAFCREHLQGWLESVRFACKSCPKDTAMDCYSCGGSAMKEDLKRALSIAGMKGK